MVSNRQCSLTKAAQNPDEPAFEMTIAQIPEEIPADKVLLKVLACGVCHSDCSAVLGHMGVQFPTVPGHEVIGKVVKTGEGGVSQTFGEGDVVGIGWHGDHCLSCEACTDGDFICCSNGKITGFHQPGGYQEYMLAPAKALARVPKGMDPVIAAPLMCAGVTVFNGLRNNLQKAKPPAIVGVVGIGGLGHLAIQYAAKMGYTVVAISRGTSKKDHCIELGASHYIDSKAENSSQALQALGGAKVIMCTASNSKVMSECLDGLARNGKLVVIGAVPEPIQVSPFQIIQLRKSVHGWPSGTNRDSQDALEFANLHHIVPKTVVFEGIKQAPDAYSAMRKGEYRVVLKVATD